MMNPEIAAGDCMASESVFRHGHHPSNLMTPEEVIMYLRLDTDQRNCAERLRNLIRRQGLPVIRRGKLRLFRREAVDAWLDAGQRGGRRTARAGRD